MSGISGIIDFNKNPIDTDVLNRITNAIIHRGPDSGKTRIIDNVGLGHRNLRIIDLPKKTAQPLSTEDNRFTIVSDGNIYNSLQIKNELVGRGYEFISNSDAEVILKAFKEYGPSYFNKLNGMFSFAIYDKQEKELFLVRDHFGIKPLYYYMNDNVLIFGSEIKVIKSYVPQLQLTINKQSLSEYIWYGNPMGENTFYEEINEVKSGCYLKISDRKASEVPFFDINSIRENNLDETATIVKIQSLLEESVKRQLTSDVPVGIFLSGGIDSSAITAFASKHYNGRIKTYSAGFDFDKGVNELPRAKKIAHQYSTYHQEIQISGQDIIEVIEELVHAHDEPFGDAADIPLYLMTKKLKGEVKVVLQGDGGDEFFGGYSRYQTLVRAGKWKKLAFLNPIISLLNTKNVKLLRLQRFLNAISLNEPYKRNALLLTMESKYTNPLRVFNQDFKSQLARNDPFKRYKEVYSKYDTDINPTQALFFTDAQIILKDTFFEKVDRAVMANSMEVRLPFLDKELTSFMLSVPGELKTKNGVPKYLLKKALNGIVSDEVLYGKKKGFGVPYAYWLKTSLKRYFIDQIETEKASRYLDKTEILKLFELHSRGKGNFGFLLWKTLILAVWINKSDENVFR